MSLSAESDATDEKPALTTQVEELEAGRLVRFVLSGQLRHTSVDRFYRELVRILKSTELKELELQCQAVTQLDSAGVAIVSLFAQRCQVHGVSFRVTHLSQQLQKILAIMPQRPDAPVAPPEEVTALESLGSYGIEGWINIRQFYATVADTAAAVARALTGRFPPRGALTTQAVRVGVDALPIVALLSFLLGLVLAFQSADQLRAFGAEIYTANLVGIGMFREFGALLTGIVLAGRSGSAIAAELGTMKVNEEIDALHTMGIDHNRFLVLPRILAVVIVQPALTLMSNLIGALGGVLIGLFYLKIPVPGYLNQSLAAVQLSDLLQGLSKSLVFALLIGLIACFSGLGVSGGSTEVGRATTRAVVASIFMIIVADSVFTTLSTLLS